MDPVTHTFSGLTMAHVGLRQRMGRTALLAMTTRALAPRSTLNA